MTEAPEAQTFTVATDEKLVELIESARRRLVVVAPALAASVAEAIIRRCRDDALEMTVVLDADPEVYRLGYGDSSALSPLRIAMTESGLALALQPGVRIGMVISDGKMLIYSPVPRLIEAGSEVAEKPNAIMVSGGAVERVVGAARGETDGAEIGRLGLSPGDIEKMEKSLSEEPPQAFNIARAVRVFSSKAEFVELEIENLRLTTRKVTLPPELVSIRNEGLKPRISGTLNAPEEVSGPFKIMVELEDGSQREVNADSRWINEQRAKLERDFTFMVPKHGRVILIRDKPAFESAVARFKRNIEQYRAAVSDAFAKSRGKLKASLVEEFMPAWREQPPTCVTRFYPHPTDAEIRSCLSDLIEGLLDQAGSFEPLQCRTVYKGITWESANDDGFARSLREAMRKRRVPNEFIETLFRRFSAAQGGDEQVV